MGTLSLAHIAMYTGTYQQHSDAIHVFTHKETTTINTTQRG